MKKRVFIVPYVVSLVLAVGIIPLGMFLFTLPLWLGAICALLPIAIVIIFAFLRKPKGHVVSLELAGALLTGGICFFGTFCNPYWGSVMFIDSPYSAPLDTVLTYQQAQNDMNEMMNNLKRVHPKFLDGVPKDVETAYKRELEKLSSMSEITVMDLRIAMEKTVSPLHDAHTSVYNASDGTNDLYRYDYAEKAKNDWEISAVNGISFDDFFSAVSDRYSFELEEWAVKDVVYALCNNVGLDYLGLDMDGLTLEFTRKNETQTITYSEADFLPYDEYMERSAEYYADREETEEKPFVRYEIDEEHSLAVLTLESCENNELYRETLREMFTEVKNRSIQNVAVDLRDNGGGSSLVASEFIRYLDVDEYNTDSMSWRLGFFMPYFSGEKKNDRIDELTFSGNVYVLTSNDTFSSAMMFAEYITDNSLGTIIGEPPGNAANSCGDITYFQMRESGLMLVCSTKLFTRADTENTEIIVSPDIPCEKGDAYEVLVENIVRST